MGFFDKFKKKEEEVLPVYGDEVLLAPATGAFVGPDKIDDPMFAQEMMGQTVAIEPTEGTIVSPANGVVEVLFPTKHAFAIRMANGQGLLVHIGINTVEMNGKGFKTLVNQGDKVKAGQKVVEADLKAIKSAGFKATTMLVVTEPVSAGHKENYIEYSDVKRGQIING